MDSAILPEWHNTATKVHTMELPSGVTFYEGVAGPQKGMGGADLIGGGNQVYIEKVEKEWLKDID